jgi:tRNA dimethylallyltransferase
VDLLVAVVGPTAVGKTELAVRLAARFNGEIIGADSRQVYRGMDIGTARPCPGELARVPHHLVSIIEPDEDFSLGLYLRLAHAAMTDIRSRGRLPFLVGGTGLYVRAFLEGWDVPAISPDAEFRYNKERQARESGPDEIHAELARVDPAAAAQIDPRNVRRVIRALEVHARTGRAFSDLGHKQPPAFTAYTIGLTASRGALYRRADDRVDRMIAGGFVDEVRRLLERGYDPDLPSLSGIGYRQLAGYLRGEATLEEAVRRIKTATHRFIRHQYGWFRLRDEAIRWYDVECQGYDEIERDLSRYIMTLSSQE